MLGKLAGFVKDVQNWVKSHILRTLAGIVLAFAILLLWPLSLSPSPAANGNPREGGTAARSCPASARTGATAASQTTLTVAKGQGTTFTIPWNRQELEVAINFSYTGCITSASASILLPMSQRKADDDATAFFDYGSGQAFVRVTLDGNHLYDGTQTFDLIVSDPDDGTTAVVPLTVTHQYSRLGLAIDAAIVGLIVALYLGAAHTLRAAKAPVSLHSMTSVLKNQWLAVLAALAATWTAFKAAYLDNPSFQGGFENLIELAGKVGAASLAALVLVYVLPGKQ